MALRSRTAGWLLLIATTAAVTAILTAVDLPAALLIGPLLSAIIVAARWPGLGLPGWTATVSQSVVGCIIAGTMAGGIGPAVLARWPLFVALAAATIVVGGAIGFALARLRVVPGTVAVWGSMPGGAAAMVLMAEAEGADARLVAVMVYTRVVVVTASAALVAALLDSATIGAPGASPAASLPLTGAVALAGAGLATLLRWPGGTLLVTMALGCAAQWSGLGVLGVPRLVSVVSFALIGWRVGLTFTRDARGAALRLLPRIVLATAVLVALCGAIAGVLHLVLGIDLLTAWLAMSPGGLESLAILATSLPVDTAFIMATQTARFAAVMLVGPPLAILLARRARDRRDDLSR